VSAFGLLTVDIRNDYVRTAVSRHAELDPALAGAMYGELACHAREGLAVQGFGPGQQRLARSADLRYFGQAFEVGVPVPDGPFDAALADRVADAFHGAHRARYGYDFRADPRQQVEWVNLRVTGIGPLRRPRLAEVAAGDGDPRRARTGSRPVCFGRGTGHADTPVYSREALAAGDIVTGPAVIEEYGATVPLHPGFAATVDRFGNLRVTGRGP
jgi:N-methylhydantoinase A